MPCSVCFLRQAAVEHLTCILYSMYVVLRRKNVNATDVCTRVFIDDVSKATTTTQHGSLAAKILETPTAPRCLPCASNHVYRSPSLPMTFCEGTTQASSINAAYYPSVRRNTSIPLPPSLPASPPSCLPTTTTTTLPRVHCTHSSVCNTPSPAACSYRGGWGPTFTASRDRSIMAAGRCRWLHRQVVFKCASVGLLLSAAVFLLGFSLPRWYRAVGLWSACGNTECAASLSAPWLGAVQGLLCLSLLGYTLCISAEIYQDFWKVPPAPDNNAVEALALCTGVTSLIGATLFASKAVDSHAAHLGWSFWLVLSSSILVIICAVVIALSRRLHAQSISQPPRTIITPVYSVPAPDLQSTGILAPTTGRSKQASHKLGLSMDIPPPPYTLPPPYPYTLVQYVPPQIVFPLPQITAPEEPKLST